MNCLTEWWVDWWVTEWVSEWSVTHSLPFIDDVSRCIHTSQTHKQTYVGTHKWACSHCLHYLPLWVWILVIYIREQTEGFWIVRLHNSLHPLYSAFSVLNDHITMPWWVLGNALGGRCSIFFFFRYSTLSATLLMLVKQFILVTVYQNVVRLIRNKNQTFEHNLSIVPWLLKNKLLHPVLQTTRSYQIQFGNGHSQWEGNQGPRRLQLIIINL